MSVAQATAGADSAAIPDSGAYPSAHDLSAELEKSTADAAAPANEVGGDAATETQAVSPAEPAEPPEPAPAPQSITLTAEQFQALLASVRQGAAPPAAAVPEPPPAPPPKRSHHELAARAALGEGLPDRWYERAATLIQQRAQWEPHKDADGETGQRARRNLAVLDDRLEDMQMQAELYGANRKTQDTAQASDFRARVEAVMTPDMLKQHGYPGLSAALAAGRLTVAQLLDATGGAIQARDTKAIDRALAPWELAFSAAAPAATPPAQPAPGQPPAAKPAATVANPAVVAPTAQGGHAAPPDPEGYPSINDYNAEITRRWAQ